MTIENDDQFIDLNVLDSDNIVVQLTQEIAFEVGAVMAIDKTLSVAGKAANVVVMKATGKSIKQQVSRLVSKQMLERINSRNLERMKKKERKKSLQVDVEKIKKKLTKTELQVELVQLG